MFHVFFARPHFPLDSFRRPGRADDRHAHAWSRRGPRSPRRRASGPEALLRRLVSILGQSRRTEADLVLHVGEVDARRLYAREASPSMFAYCTERLHLSEAEAYLTRWHGLRATLSSATREEQEYTGEEGWEGPMTSTRWNADLLLLALAIGAVALSYSAGAFVMALALHPPGQLGWSLAEKVAVGLYPLGWVGLAWAAADMHDRWHRRRASGPHA